MNVILHRKRRRTGGYYINHSTLRFRRTGMRPMYLLFPGNDKLRHIKVSEMDDALCYSAEFIEGVAVTGISMKKE